MKTAKRYRQIGNIPGSLALDCCDIGIARVDDNDVMITWGRNLDENTIKYFEQKTFFIPVKIGVTFELIIPEHIATQLMPIIELNSPVYIYESHADHGETVFGTRERMEELYEALVPDWNCTVDECIEECIEWEKTGDTEYTRLFRNDRGQLLTEIARFTPIHKGAEEYTKEMIKRWDEETEDDE